MRLTKLKIANLRAIETAEFRFQPGFNLIVGVNGVGKTTVLDAISRCLSHAISKMGYARLAAVPFSEVDIRYGATTTSVQVDIETATGEGLAVQDIYHRAEGLMGRPGEIPVDWNVLPEQIAQRRGRLRRAMRQAQEREADEGGTNFIPSDAAFSRVKSQAKSSPLAVYFSTIRAFPSANKARKGRAAQGIAVAYADAFTGRELRLAEFAEWMRSLEETKDERPDAVNILAALNLATERFLPGYFRLRASSEEKPRLLLDHSARATVAVKDLSGYDRARLDLALEVTSDHMAVNWPDTMRDAELTPTQVSESAEKERHRVTEEALTRYMPGYERLRGTGEFGDHWIIDRLPVTLDAKQLSDGERGVLALVLDLTRRLAQANPGMNDPAANAEAVVLIDEIDLHLHPKWQRQIVQNLLTAFPKCQFIATTHSPQVIGEVEHNRIQVIKDGQVYSPLHSFGVDSSRVLEEIMDSQPRTQRVGELLAKLSRLLGDSRLKEAKASLASLAENLGEDDPEVIRLRTLLDFVEGNE